MALVTGFSTDDAIRSDSTLISVVDRLQLHLDGCINALGAQAAGVAQSDIAAGVAGQLVLGALLLARSVTSDLRGGTR